MINVEKLLKKKGWTGKELGRLELAMTLNALHKSLQGDTSPERIVSEAEFRKMLDTITDPYQGKIYNEYITIHEWFANNYSYAVANEQQALFMHSTLMNTLTSAMLAENVYEYISQLPAIFTEKQYKDLVTARTKEILTPNGETLGFNVFNLVELAIDYYVRQLSKEPRKKNPLKPLKKKLEAERVTDSHILDRYVEVTGLGYYEMEDGTRSDQLTKGEWKSKVYEAFIKSDIFQKVLEKADELEQSGIIARIMTEEVAQIMIMTKEVARTATEKELKYFEDTEQDTQSTIENMQLAYVELVEQVKLPPEEYLNEFADYCIIAKWHFYDSPPEDLNKWEVLEAGNLYEYYTTLASDSSPEMQIDDITAFREEFPEVVEAILGDMEHYIKGVKSMTVSEWIYTVYSWEELYKLDMYGFRSMYTDDVSIFEGNERAIFNGIAIVRPSTLLERSPRIDPETGYYKPPKVEKIMANGLEQYFTDNENYADNVRELELARKRLIEAIYFYKGFDKILDLIISYYDVDEFNLVRFDVSRIEAKVKAFNSLLVTLYDQIKHTNYEDKELKEKKLEVLRDVFTPIDLSKIKIPKYRIDKAITDIKEKRAFVGGMNDIRVTLCYMPSKEEMEAEEESLGGEADE